jgi:hypothetical protein
LNGGKAVTLADTFDDDYPTKNTKTDANQSIDYSSIKITSAGKVSYDYSGSTGTFVIPDSTPVTITYRTRITAHPGEAKNFRGTAVLKTNANGREIARATAGVTGNPVAIYPSASDVEGTGKYMVKLLVYPEGNMQEGIKGATFILLDANQRPLEYKLGDNKGQPVTFTTGNDGYVNIELNEEPGDVSIEKNTAYYLEMMQAVEGYQKDNTLYSFMITDDPDYNSGGFWTYYNGDTMKVRLYKAKPGLKVSIRFSGSYALRDEQKNAVSAVLQKLDDNGSPIFSFQVVIEGVEGERGSGYSKKEAQQNASKETLQKLKREPQFVDAIFKAKSDRTKMEETPTMLVPDPEKEQQDFIIEQPAAEQPENPDTPETPEIPESSEKPEPSDEFDLSDISHKEKSREDIIAEAEAAAFAEE